MNEDKVIRLKPEPEPKKAAEELPVPNADIANEINNRLIPSNRSSSNQRISKETQVGNSVKLRNLFALSGAVASEATVVSVTAAGSSGNETDLKSFRFYGYEFHVGMLIRITAIGVYSSDGTRTVTLRIGSGLAPTTEWNSATSTAASTANAPWHITWYGIVASLGTSGTLEAQMISKINNVNKDDANSATVAINTQTGFTVAFTADWDGTDANNSISVRQWVVEIIR